MSNTRDKLAEARRGYERLRYPGDLAGDVFARIDAGEHHAADSRLDDVDADALQKINPMRIGVGAARSSPSSSWRPVWAIAAAAAILASTVAVLVQTGRDQTPVAVNLPTPAVEPQKPVATTAAEENVDFTIVPSYQSFAFSTPASLTPASIEEYDQQARETSSSTSTADQKTTAADGASAVQ